jgi:hypothetical protein
MKMRAERFLMSEDKFAGRVMCALMLLMLGIAALDAVTGRQISLWIAYVMPVALAGWLLGFRAGFWLALLAGALLMGVGLIWGSLFSSYWYFAFAVLSRTTCFVFIAWLCHRLRLTQELEHTVQAYEELCESLHIGLVDRKRANRRVER